MNIAPKHRTYRFRRTKGLARMLDIIDYAMFLAGQMGRFRIFASEITGSSSNEFDGRVNLPAIYGTPGATGDPGYPGPPGPTGSSIFGPEGLEGFFGPPGTEPGDKGDLGDPGARGDSGGAGPKGAVGPTGPDGLPGPPGGPGPNSGPIGPTGPTGTNATGYPGPPGTDGPPGPPGDDAPNGVPSSTPGPTGAPGIVGPTGFPGPPGNKLAIVESCGLYVGFQVHEAPQTMFRDHVRIKIPARETRDITVTIDPRWLECLDPNNGVEILSLQVAGGGVTAAVERISETCQRIILRCSQPTRTIRTAYVTIQGVARGRHGRRFPEFTREQMECNTAFWSAAIDTAPMFDLPDERR